MLAIPAFAFLYLLGTEATAQDCGEVCTWDFWESSTQQEVEEAIRNVNVNARDQSGLTPLHWVAQSGVRENILLLLEAGADVNATTADGKTPLHWAAMRGSPDSVAVLLDDGANLDARDMDGKTPLHRAAQAQTPETVTILQEAGADGAIEDVDGNTPFDLAEESEDLRGTTAYWALNDARFK